MEARRTHQAIDPAFSGAVVAMSEGRARLRLATTEAMRADEHGLIHGGFVFSLADHAAMLAINHPNVVLGSAAVRFLAPVALGDRLEAEAVLGETAGKKLMVEVVVRRQTEQDDDQVVFRGDFTCFTPPHHVLDQGG